MGKSTTKKVMSCIVAGTLAVSALSGCKNSGYAVKVVDFTPSLDTSREICLNIVGDNESLPALEEIVKDFNEYYPNCTIEYEYLQNYRNSLTKRLAVNGDVDIFMGYADDMEVSDEFSDYVTDLSDVVDLSNYNENISDILVMEDGEILSAPLGITAQGIVANTTLLESEGLEFPQNLQALEAVCGSLVEKGYTPIQGSNETVYAYLTEGMAMLEAANDDEIRTDENADDSRTISTVLGLLDGFIEKGYVSYDVNRLNDGDYSSALENFLKGDIPFLVANASAIGSLEKREGSVDEYAAEPFEYEFFGMPLSDDGIILYGEPWQGLSVNSKGENVDYSKEFIRFASTVEELNKFSLVKNIPSASSAPPEDTKYSSIYDIPCGMFVMQGSVDVPENFIEACEAAATALGTGEADTDEATQIFEKNLEEL